MIPAPRVRMEQRVRPDMLDLREDLGIVDEQDDQEVPVLKVIEDGLGLREHSASLDTQVNLCY